VYLVTIRFAAGTTGDKASPVVWFALIACFNRGPGLNRLGVFMAPHLNRRTALGLGAVVTGALTFGVAGTALADTTSDSTDDSTSAAENARSAAAVRAVAKAVYQSQKAKAGGTWNSYISVTDTDGSVGPAVDDASTTVVQSYSVNKLGVATALLDKVDRGELKLTDTVEVTADIVIPDGDGIFRLDGGYPSTVTLGHALAALLTVSDDTAVRLCGTFTTSTEINQILVAKGFPNTQVEPVANPHRFYLGTTTPREMHGLLQALVKGTLLSAASTSYLLSIIRSPIAFTDGIRREMSSDERGRIATKAGWFDDGRNEAGIIFDTDGNPVLTYSLFAHGQDHPEDFGATHPAVQARAVMGRIFLTAIDALYGQSTARDQLKAAATTGTFPTPAYHPSNGG
jgi:beta-lactamase class A